MESEITRNTKKYTYTSNTIIFSNISIILLIIPLSIYFIQSHLRPRITSDAFRSSLLIDEKTELSANNLKATSRKEINSTSEQIIPARKTIAYAITITKDGFFQDGAAVLAYSIITASKNRDYNVTLIAFVHPNVTLARPFLHKIGFQ